MPIFLKLNAFFWMSVMGLTPLLWAQTTPTAEQMVEQLKSPRTRSLRNLTVEPVANPATASTQVPAQNPIATTPAPISNAAATSAGAPAQAAAQTAAPTAITGGPLAAAAPVSSATPVTAPSISTPASPSPPAQEPKASLSLLIQFDFNSARVRAESLQALANLASALKSPDLLASQFAIEGHTDATGRADYNLRLSQQRADAVRGTLVAQGVAPERLRSAGKGASELANSTNPSAAENRRVRIVNLD
jgi:OmpA-OmpF porin, OOP family